MLRLSGVIGAYLDATATGESEHNAATLAGRYARHRTWIGAASEIEASAAEGTPPDRLAAVGRCALPSLASKADGGM
jgi:hypothetical protein